MLELDSAKKLYNLLSWDEPFDPGHSLRVGQLSHDIALTMGFSKQKALELFVAGLLHDIGKLWVPMRILQQSTPLTKKERVYIVRHPIWTGEVLASLREFERFSRIASLHHERWDGKGYPHGLSKNEIPVESRILAVADAFDAMTSDRPYKRAMDTPSAIEEIQRHSGKQFCPEAADAAIEFLRRQQQPDIRRNKSPNKGEK